MRPSPSGSPLPCIANLPCRLNAMLTIALVILSTGRTVHAAQHPLDPLSADEISQTVEVLKASGKVTDASEFPLLDLHEPPKGEVLAFHPGDSIRREAFATVYDRADAKTFEAVVDLTDKKIISWKEIPGVQPAIMLPDVYSAYKAVFADPRFAEAMKKRGITDLTEVSLDPWSVGYNGPSHDDGHRIVAMVPYYQGKLSNMYARPIENVRIFVDVNTGKVIDFADSGVVPVATGSAEYAGSATAPVASAPTGATQPSNPNFMVDGNEVSWKNWRFRFSVDEREGLVLQTVGYEDGGRVRSILYRASLSEIFVPYADPGSGWYFRNPLDEGDTGLGWLSDSLEPGTDVPASSRFFDAVIADQTGHPRVLPRAAALYERDGGLLWKHVDLSGKNAGRTARELVLTYFMTLGNYDYGLEWIFHEDGTLEAQVLLTGIVSPKGVASPADATYSRMMADGVAAVDHQHFFNFRLDMDVDGASGNSVMEMNTSPAPQGAQHAQDRAFVTRETMLMTELQGKRQLNSATARCWTVINPNVRNPLGGPVGYGLMPETNSVSFIAPESWAGKRGGFAASQLWVTPYDPGEMHAAGDYPNQSKGGDGLPKWTAANRSIENRDLVLWYTVGVTHVPRPEQWPIMDVDHAGFKLVPVGFFSHNPTTDSSPSPLRP